MQNRELTAVASSISSTSLVRRVLGHTTVLCHLDKVESTVQATRKVGDVHIKSELLIEKVEHLVSLVVLHQVCARANVDLPAIGDEVKLERVSASGNTIGALIVGTIKGAVCSTCHVIWAKGAIPGVAGIAVCRPRGRMHPSPVGVNHDLAIDSGAAVFGSALLPSERWVSLSLKGSDLLRLDGSEDGKESSSTIHLGE